MSAGPEDLDARHDADPDVVRVSVVIPAFDAERTLREQLAALRAQRPGLEWEVLVCDNGSRDATRDVVAELAHEWPRVRLVDASARRGPSAARNIGARAARGEHLLFCDADDVVGTGWVAAMSGALADHALVAGRHEGELLNAGSPMRLSRTIQDHELFTKPFLPGLPAAGSGNLGVRRDVFLALGGFCEDARVGEDVDLCWRAQLSGHDLVFLGDAVVHVRKRDTVRALCRQMYATGAGDRWLARRFAGVRVPTTLVPPTTAPTAPVPPALASRAAVWAARARRLASARTPGDIADWACTASFWWGSRFGRFTPPEPWVPVEHEAVLAAVVESGSDLVEPVDEVSRDLERGRRRG